MMFNSGPHDPPRDGPPDPPPPTPRRLPVVRAECEGEGVCLYLSCRHNLTVEIVGHQQGDESIVLNAPGKSRPRRQLAA